VRGRADLLRLAADSVRSVFPHAAQSFEDVAVVERALHAGDDVSQGMPATVSELGDDLRTNLGAARGGKLWRLV
jgi:hypothetical protein